MSKKNSAVSIVGYGRFGKVLHQLLKDDFSVTIYRRSKIVDRTEFNQNTVVAQSLEDIYKNDVVFFAVPIDSFDQVISEHKQYFRDGHLLIDVLSVKLYPARILSKHLRGTTIQALLTHPMFGPDSSKEGFDGLPMIIDKFIADATNYNFWKEYFISKQLRVIEMNAQQHDKLAANSQGLTHFLGRLLDNFGLQSTPIDSLGTKKLLEITEQTCNDSWQLFSNLQHYNPYTGQMRLKLGKKFDALHNELLPKQLHADRLTIGIQGGIGSFNEEAVHHYVAQSGIKNCTIEYLHTSANVLKQLHAGKVDRGQFAIHNSAGGIVDESVQAMADYTFKIIDQFAVKIAHALMIREDADFSDVTTIMTHPQVLAQCKRSLRQKYSHLDQTSGEGRLIDHALVAKHLGEKKIPKHVATMGSRALAQLYKLRIVEENLQDLKDNFTTFLVVARR